MVNPSEPKYEAQMQIVFADGRTESSMLVKMKAQTFEVASKRAGEWAHEKLKESGGHSCMLAVYERGKCSVTFSGVGFAAVPPE